MVGLPPPWVLGLRFQALSIQFSRHKFASRTEDRRLLEARETMSVKPRGPTGVEAGQYYFSPARGHYPVARWEPRCFPVCP